MSVSLAKSVNHPLSERHGGVSNADISKSPSRDSLDDSSKTDPTISDDSKNDQKSEPSTPTLHPMAFTIDFGQSKEFDKSKLQELAKKSQARHQRIQSMSASFTKPSSVAQKPPLSVNLPRKAQGYNSEGYFSSDQEDSTLSGSVKLRQSPLAQTLDRSYIPATRNLQSPVNDVVKPKKLSKSPIVDSIMSRSDILPSRSDNLPSRQNLNLPLKSPISSYLRDINRTPSYGNISASYQLKSTMADILDCSPDGMMLTDVSSPDFDALTPDHVTYISEPRSPGYCTNRRAVSEMPDLVYNKNMLSKEQLYIDDDIDNKSDNSSTGTYTIEDNNYTEEQKARMSIDRTFAGDNIDDFEDKKDNRRSASKEKDPELIFDYPEQKRPNLLEHRLDTSLRSPKKDNATFSYPHKVSKDKNVLEISCCYESPTENDLATQTSKQIKSTRSYLEKIKSRVKTITEKTFSKSPPKIFENPDHGGVTSVTTSGILSSKFPPKSDLHLSRRRCSLAKSEIDQTDYVHRLARESSVPLNLPSTELKLPFESTPLRNAQKMIKKADTPSEVVGQLSYLSLNRCKGDKTWIQEWADSVKKYNKDLVDEVEDSDQNRTFTMDEEEEMETQKRGKNSRLSYTSVGTPSKIPSPVGSIRMNRCTPDLIPASQDTGCYLQKTQTAITNLQAKIHSSKPNLHQFSPQNSTLLNEKHISTRLPVPQNFSPIPQLSRSNSLNYRLRRKVNSTDSSPLRSPGNYIVIGSTKFGETKKLLDTASKSLEHDPRKDVKSPVSDKDLSNSSDEKTLSYKPPLQTPKKHSRHSSFDGRNAQQFFNADLNNSTISLKNVLRNNAENYYQRIDLTSAVANRNNVRIQSEGKLKNVYTPNNLPNTSIKRSSSFNTVSKYPYLDYRRQNDTNDYLSDDSDTEKTIDYKYRKRIDSPEYKSNSVTKTSKCPNTPEMKRKFGPGLARCSVRVTNKERALNCRLSESPIAVESRNKPANHQSRISDTTRQSVFNRLTKSKSSTREPQQKVQEKVQKKPIQHRSSSALATKEVEFSNWKKRASYDPMKAAQEGKKRQQVAKRSGCNKDDNSSPSHSSPVHRSQSFHNTNMAELQLSTGYGSDDSIDDDTSGLQLDPMVTSVMSDCVDLRRNTRYREMRYQPPQQTTPRRHLDIDKRKTFILDDDQKLNLDNHSLDKRKTFILDSDTNSTTSPRNSSIFSQEKNSVRTCTSDTDNDSGPENAPVVVTRRAAGTKSNSALRAHRHSGDFSMSSSTTSISQSQPQKPKATSIQPRYMDISKYKNEQQTNKNFLRRDPSRTYVTVLYPGEKASPVSKGSAQHYEMEQKKQELEKWKRRASYDPRKAAAQGKPTKQSPKSASSVLRSQSFHGPVYLQQSTSRYQHTPLQIAENYDVSSDNDF